MMDPQQPNKKSLKRAKGKTLSRRQQLQDDLVASDIASRMQLGISEIEILSDLIDQQIPMDEIQMAFGKIGMNENDFSSLVSNYQQAMSGQQQAGPDYAMPPQMQFGGGSVYFPSNISQGNRMKGSDYIPAQGTYLPQDLGNKGNVLGAVSTLAEGAANLFGKKDRDGDGLMDGAFRDGQAKRRAFKRGKASQFDYTDSEGNPIGGGEYSDEELFKASKDPNYIPRKQVDLAKEYSRFGTDEEGGLQSFITDRPFDKRDYTKNKKSTYNRNKLEDLYSGMKPAGEFDFNPFMKAAQEEQQAEEESEARAEEAVQERKTPSVAIEEAIVEEATVPKTSTAPAVSAVSPSKPFDRTDIYNQILDFEYAGGSLGFDTQGNPKAVSHPRYGNNIYDFVDDQGNKIDPSNPRYREMLMAKMEEVYGQDLKDFSPEAQGAMIDYGYGSGNDPRIYMLDQYMKEQGLGDLPYRSSYNDHMDKYEWDDDTYKTQFENQYAKYADKINALSGTEQLRLMNQGRKFYYDNIQTQDRDAANDLIWSQRPFYKRGGDLVKYQGGTEFKIPKIESLINPEEENSNMFLSPYVNFPSYANTSSIPTVDVSKSTAGNIQVPYSPEYNTAIDDTFTNMLPEVTINANTYDVFNPSKIDAEPIETNTTARTTVQGVPEVDLTGIQAGTINKERKSGSRMKRFLDSPGINKFSSAANFGVAAAGVANEMFQNKRALDAENELDLKTADDLYGTFEEREGDRGMYDVNTGLAQPDNLDVGYAMNGMEMPMMGAPMPRLDTNKEVDLDMETITKLIAAGADIEIL